MPTQATMTQTDSFFNATIEQSPKFSMGSRQDLVVGGNVPSWTNSIPGPKYNYDTNVVKPRAPASTMGTKPEMVVGGEVPSWKSSIPGPYTFDPDVIRQREPYSRGFTMAGRNVSSATAKTKADSRNASTSAKRDRLRLTAGFNMITRRSPSWHLSSKPEMVVGGDVPSWKKSIPGPYDCNPDVVKTRQPNYSMGKRLASESDLMKERSPGPLRYGGAASNVHKQAEVDSSKRRSLSPTFGTAPRWEGKAAEIARGGGTHRYERPVIRVRVRP